MKQRFCRLTEIRVLWSDVQMLTVATPELARMRPGQFALLRDPAQTDPYLRRAAWFYQVAGEQVGFTLSPSDPFAEQLRAGDILDLLAPLGAAIEFRPRGKHVLLIAETSRVPPLVAIARDALAQHLEVVLFVHTLPSEPVFPAHLLPPEIEYRTDHAAPGPDLISWADHIIANGSAQMYRDVADWIRMARYRLEPGLARVLADLPMPCGTGACYVCALETSGGIRLACTDGPAFDLAELGMAKRI